MAYVTQIGAGGATYTVKDASIWGDIAPEYDATAAYAVGDLSLKDGQLYRCTTAIASGEAWNASHWASTTISDEMSCFTVLNGKLCATWTE